MDEHKLCWFDWHSTCMSSLIPFFRVGMVSSVTNIETTLSCSRYHSSSFILCSENPRHHQGAFFHTAVQAAAPTNQSTLASSMRWVVSSPHSDVEVLTLSTWEGNLGWRQKYSRKTGSLGWAQNKYDWFLYKKGKFGEVINTERRPCEDEGREVGEYKS